MSGDSIPKEKKAKESKSKSKDKVIEPSETTEDQPIIEKDDGISCFSYLRFPCLADNDQFN